MMRFTIGIVTILVTLLVPWRPQASVSDLDLSIKRGQLKVEVDVVDEDENPVFSPEGEALVQRMAVGFLKKTRQESKRWWGCGVETPEDDQLARAETISRQVLSSLRDNDLRWLSHWAVLGTIWSESRGDPCAIGPNSRAAARDMGLIPEDRMFNRWSAEDVKSVLEHPKWKKSRAKIGADLGLGQMVWQRYARILDKDGDKLCGKGYPCRVPTLDEILSYDDGAKVVITGMVSRRHMYRSTMPWEHWPGSVRSLSYGMKIARIAQDMGGSIRERPVW